jgi:hypothetical protein
MKKVTFRGWDGIVAVITLGMKRGHRDCHGLTKRESDKRYRVWIKKDQNEKEELDTLIHEMLHCASWQSEEDWVAQTATGIADALYEWGFRRVD